MLSVPLLWLKHHPDLLAALAVFSVVAFFGTLLLLPLLIIRVPEDYFLDHPIKSGPAPRRAFFRFLSGIGRNVLGAMFILAGIAMLVLPGQGLLTILIGLVFINFPGKWKLARALVRRKVVFSAINTIRAKAGRPPIKIGSIE
jgi:hypothetical protein